MVLVTVIAALSSVSAAAPAAAVADAEVVASGDSAPTGSHEEQGESDTASAYVFGPDGALDVPASVAAFTAAYDGLQPDALAAGTTLDAWSAMRADAVQFVSASLADPTTRAIIETEGPGSGSDGDDAADVAARGVRCYFTAYFSWIRQWYYIFPTYSNYTIEGPFSCTGGVPLTCKWIGYVIAGVPPPLIPVPGSGLLRYNYACFTESTSLAGVRPTTGSYVGVVLTQNAPVIFRPRGLAIY